MSAPLWVEEAEFAKRMAQVADVPNLPDFITGPGRSGAIAAVYASYVLQRPFVQWLANTGDLQYRRVLIVDTASMSGRTIRKARSRYEGFKCFVDTFVAFDERERRHHFWFERMAETMMKARG